MSIEPPEVNQFTRRIDLRLLHRLGLIEHRRRIQALSIGTCEEVSRTVEDGCSSLKAQFDPRFLCQCRTVASSTNLVWTGEMHSGDHMLMVVWDHLIDRPPSEHMLPVDDARDLDDDATLSLEFRFEGRTLRSARCIGQDRFIVGVSGHDLLPNLVVQGPSGLIVRPEIPRSGE